MIIDNLNLESCVRLAKRWTIRYSKNHKGRNSLEKECILKGYLVKRIGEIFPNCIEDEKNKLGVFALDFSIIHRKGGFILVR